MLFIKRQPFDNCAAPEISSCGSYCKVSFAASPCGGISCLWFHFSIGNDGRGALPELTHLCLKHILMMLDASTGDFRPVINYGTGWERLPQGEVLLRPDGHRSVQWTIRTPAPGEFAEIAFCYPYGLAELKNLRRICGSNWQWDEIGVSNQGRPIFRLANTYGSSTHPQAGFYLLARQHAGETSGAWVLDGVIRHLARNHAEFPVWCVPIVDMDGVVEERFGKDSFPQDINRAWGPGFPMRSEICVLMNDLYQWQQRIDCTRSFIFDFHSPGAVEKGMYAFVHSRLPADSPLLDFLSSLKKHLSPFASEKFILQTTNQQHSAWGNYHSLCDYAWATMGISAASFETSYFEAGNQVLTIEDYQNIGRIIADQMMAIAHAN